MLGAAAADAHITQIQITTHESPTFGGFSWPGVGQYEKIAGKAFGEVNPHDPKNSVIVDLALAPRNARGNVEYSFDFYILKPIDLSKGAHKVMYEPPNRGGKTWATLGRVTLDGPASNGNDPGSAITNPIVLANAFFMPRGYTMVWSGWDKAAGTNSANFNTTITLPIAKNPDGSSITGPAFEYIVFASATALYTLNYPAANVADTATAKLTHRVRLDDTPVAVPPAAPGTAGWQYAAGGGALQLLSASGAVTSFIANDIYEFSYTAKDPTVNGVGFAAVRDWNEWLRFETQDDLGNPNPLAGDIKRIYTEAARAAAGDPRPSVAERYPTFDTYDNKVIKAMNHLIQRRLELCEDGPAELQRLRVLGVAQGVPNPPAAFTPFSFPLANSSIKASPSSLWPANNRLVPVSLSVQAPTTCESSCKVVQVSGNNVTRADFQITGPLSVNLRASGGGDQDRHGRDHDRDARVYSVQLQCTDSANNSATKSVSVAVGHDDDDGHHEGDD
jgi:hypothetical protein